MCIETVNVDKILREIERLNYYATDFNFDGWTQNLNREKLIKIKEAIEKIDEKTFILHEAK